MSETIFHVGLSCEGCVNAIKRIVGKFPETSVTSFDIPGKEVKVSHPASVSQEDLMAALQKWANASGKELSIKA
jgi:copper chaperone CopZ